MFFDEMGKIERGMAIDSSFAKQARSGGDNRALALKDKLDDPLRKSTHFAMDYEPSAKKRALERNKRLTGAASPRS